MKSRELRRRRFVRSAVPPVLSASRLKRRSLVNVRLATVTYFDGAIPMGTEEYLDHRKALKAVGLSEQDVHADS